jgi:mono/diheme cytochrome c family protein
MRRALAGALAAVAALVVAASARAGSDGQDFARIERGRYLTSVGDCAGCHTDVGGLPLAGGLAVETPFGTVTASNITPDRQTGIGAWTDDQFVRALTRGIRPDGSHLYPAMPYPYYTKVSRDDLLAIRAYLATVPAVKHKASGDQLPFPLDMRIGMAVWNKLFFTPGPFHLVSGKSAEWNRGAYLVEGLMHCGACHTPKNLAGGDKTGERLQGSPLQGWFAPDLTEAPRRGLQSWSVDDIVTYLMTGHNKFAAAAGPMGEEVALSSSRMNEADLRAVAVYLKDQRGGDEQSPAPLSASDPAMKSGAAIYADECSACHGPRGTGQLGLFPSLAGAASVQSLDPTSLIRVVLGGTRSAATAVAPTAPAMPAFGWVLNDREAAAVLTYIRNAWGNAAPAVGAAQVHEARKALSRQPNQ